MSDIDKRKLKFIFKVETGIEGETIHQKVYQDGKKIMESVLKTREEQIRQALIKLGWTPPP